MIPHGTVLWEDCRKVRIWTASSYQAFDLFSSGEPSFGRPGLTQESFSFATHGRRRPLAPHEASVPARPLSLVMHSSLANIISTPWHAPLRTRTHATQIVSQRASIGPHDGTKASQLGGTCSTGACSGSPAPQGSFRSYWRSSVSVSAWTCSRCYELKR